MRMLHHRKVKDSTRNKSQASTEYYRRVNYLNDHLLKQITLDHLMTVHGSPFVRLLLEYNLGTH